MQVTKDIINAGVNDHKTDLFEGQYNVPDGMCYNSYVIKDTKTAVLDTVDAKFTDEWINNLKSALDNTQPDYLIISHMEPDHSASIERFINEFPFCVLVGNTKTFAMLEDYYHLPLEEKKLVVADNSTLTLGKHELTFIFAPMVHWPEVMVTYDKCDCVLFSADGFGKFGALDVEKDWDDEARRYYIGIVGKYGAQVQSLLKKASALDIKTICPLHGPVLNENLSHYISLYDTWSSYKSETDGVLVAYTSVYGHTKKAAQILTETLNKKGCKNTELIDLARTDWAYSVACAFRYSNLVLATTTYNSDLFPAMKQFIDHLTERNYQNRRIAIIENGSWAPVCSKLIKDKFIKSKNISFVETETKIKCSLSDDNLNSLDKMADEIISEINK